MSNHFVDVPQTIVDVLNETFTGRFTAVRRYQTQSKLEELGVLKVDVVLAEAEGDTELVANGTLGYKVPANILLRYRFKQADIHDGEVKPELVDTYINLLQEIYESLVKRLFVEDDASWDSAKIVLRYSPTMLEENEQYLGVIQVVFNAESAV